MRLSKVAPGWPSLPCQSPDLVGVSPTNAGSTARVIVLQFTTTGSLWGQAYNWARLIVRMPFGQG